MVYIGCGTLNSFHCATEISALLTPPSPLQVQEHYHNLLSARGCSGITVKQDGNSGKGLYAGMDFKEGELVLKDPMLVGAQHPLNKIDCLVCSFCFRFVGSIELQIGRKLYMQQLRANESHGCDVGSSSKHCHEMDSSDEEESTQQCTSGSPKTKVPLPEDVVQSLMNGQLVLPFSEKFSLPPAVPCPGGCGEAYYCRIVLKYRYDVISSDGVVNTCSMSCAEVDWESSHSLLCTGESSDSARREALLKFIKHANAISSTMLKYRKLKAVSLEKQMKHDISCVSNHCNLSILLEAWKPILMGHKRRWWDCIALPDDVDSSDEASFRLQIKMLAFESLQLLKKAIFDKECESCILADADFVMFIMWIPSALKKLRKLRNQFWMLLVKSILFIAKHENENDNSFYPCGFQCHVRQQDPLSL
ncbi:hypothetical protein JHK82_037758 [Glycine max]|nr:hypothetical protein JHK82_037758 [Glycine max]